MALVPASTMYLVVPPRLEKQYLLLSPLITSRDLPIVIDILCNNFGISIIDLQKINYPKFLYDSPTYLEMNRNLCFFKVRGSTYNIEVGFVMKIARESLLSKFKTTEKKLVNALSHLSQDFGSLFYLTRTASEHSLVR